MLNKRLIKQIVVESYANGRLDEDKVTKIASLLNHEDLKVYIKALKYTEKKSRVVVESPFPMNEDSKKTIQGIFPSKRLVYNVDPSLLLGLKLTDNDTIYDISLKRKFEMIESFLDENYD